MLKNHFKFAIRIFLKDGIYSVLNLLGLTLGISVGIILLLYLQNELSYDSQHEKKDQIYRITHHLKAQGADFNTARTSRELAPILKEEIPEVLNYVRFNQGGTMMITVKKENGEAQQFYEEHIVQTDSTFFSIFTHEIIEGNPKICLAGPNKIVLTESVAKKYFGDSSAFDKTLIMPNGSNRRVSAVISDLPDNAHLKYDILLSNIEKRTWVTDTEDLVRKSEGFWNPGCYTYLLMPKGYDTFHFEPKFEMIYDKYFKAFGDKISGSATSELQPLTSIHFESELTRDEPTGDIKFVYTFALIGLFIVLLACINYVNLSTARSVIRTKEMGVRKVLGYTRIKLFVAVLLEAFLLASIAMVLAIVADFLILEFSPFNSWINKNLSLDFIGNSSLLLGTLSITMLVGLISGVYPALYIPSIPVVTALKGSFSSQQSGIMLRKSLIVLQFVVSIFVVITTVLMDRQISYLKSSNLGFDKQNVVLIQVQDTLVSNKMNSIKNELISYHNVTAAATSYGIPGRGVGGQVFRVEREGEMVQQEMRTIYAGNDYINTMGLQLLQGRDFRDSEVDLRKSIILNETAAKELGWGEDPLNKRIRYFHGEDDMHVIGVVKDFNFESLHNKIKPMFLLLAERQGGSLNVRVNGQDLEGTLGFLEEKFNEFDPNHPFEYLFLDQEFDKQYRADQIQHQLISSLSYICIFISILGLIGLSAFTAGQKSKEISIRKSLGASVSSILFLFSKGYVKLILIAFIISVPIVDYIIVDWLAGFAYQMIVKWYYYALPGVFVLLFGLATVVMQSLKSAKMNPVDGLRSE